MGFPCASLAVTVTVEAAPPAVIGDVAVIVDWDAATAPAVTPTVAVSVITKVPLTVAVIVFTPAAVELRVPVISPFAPVVPTGCVSAFPATGAAASATLAPLTGLSNASLTVTAMVAMLEPELAVMDGGVADTNDRPALGAAALPVALKMTGLPLSPDETAVSVFVSAFVPSVHEVTVAMPLALVVTGVVGTTVPLPAAAANVTEMPSTGLLN